MKKDMRIRAPQFLKFHVLAAVEFDIGARDEREARRLAEEALFYGTKCYSYGDICVVGSETEWKTDDPFSEVGPIERDGTFEDYYEEEEDNEED